MSRCSNFRTLLLPPRRSGVLKGYGQIHTSVHGFCWCCTTYSIAASRSAGHMNVLRLGFGFSPSLRSAVAMKTYPRTPVNR